VLLAMHGAYCSTAITYNLAATAQGFFPGFLLSGELRPKLGGDALQISYWL
jgi:hypothetical protein